MLWTTLALAALLCYCAAQPVQLSRIAVWQTPPNNVYMHFAMEPPNATWTHFAVSESDSAEDPGDISVESAAPVLIQLQNTHVTFVHVLIDQSRSIAVDFQQVTNLLDSFLAGMQPRRVFMAASFFRGEDQLFPVWPGLRNSTESRLGLHQLRGRPCAREERNCDPSTNFHGAIINGLAILDRLDAAAAAHDGNLTRVLLVLSDGIERTHRRSLDDLQRAMSALRGEHAEWQASAALEGFDIIRTGMEHQLLASADALIGLVAALSDETERRREYIVAYCSPARHGSRVLHFSFLESNNLTAPFDATMFAAGPGDCSQTNLTGDWPTYRSPTARVDGLMYNFHPGLLPNKRGARFVIQPSAEVRGRAMSTSWLAVPAAIAVIALLKRWT